MTSPEFQRLNALFDELADLPVERRRACLDAASGISDATRAKISRLLDAHERVGDATLRPLVDTEIFEPRRWLGRRIGPYRVERELGHGGMGSVFRARRAEGGVDQVVAIKIVRPERLDENTLARFRLERQVLAVLRHPNIATMIDLGELDDGSPYVVMEYIEGVPITTYAKDLDLKRKLALFLIICDAVAYAHRNMIVHRDIKPGNILVDASGHPKLLDFGIAKPLLTKMGDVDIEQTGTSQQFFSIYSAAPEQLRGDVITVACDVYGLGTLMYELLTGKPAFDFTGLTPAQIEQRVLETEPAPPSSVIHLHRDLDEIVLRTLRKEPEQRYPSVDQLREDIERHISKRPVLARRGAWLYRVGRFVARHRLALTAASAVAAVFVVNGILLWRQYVISDATTEYFLRGLVTTRPPENQLARPQANLAQQIGHTAARTSPGHRIGLMRLAESGSDIQLVQASSEVAVSLFETIRDPLIASSTFDLRRRFALIDAQSRTVLRDYLNLRTVLGNLDMSFAAPVDDIAKAIIEATLPMRRAQAAVTTQQLQALYRQWNDSERVPQRVRDALAQTYAVFLESLDRPKEAVTVRRGIVPSDDPPPRTDVARNIQLLLDLANAERSAGNIVGEREAVDKALALSKRLYPGDTAIQEKVRTAAGVALVDEGKVDEGIAPIEAAIEEETKSLQYDSKITFMHANLGALLYDLPDHRDVAEKHWLAAAERATDPTWIDQRDAYYIITFAGAFEAKLGKYREAVRLLAQLGDTPSGPQVYEQDIDEFRRSVLWLSLLRSCSPAMSQRQVDGMIGAFERHNPRPALKATLAQIKGDASPNPIAGDGSGQVVLGCVAP